MKQIFIYIFFFTLNLYAFVPPAPWLLNDKNIVKKSATYFSNFKTKKSLAPKYSYQYPAATGNAKICVILMQFPDKTASSSHNTNYYNTTFFDASSNSLTKYYKEVSYNKYNLTGSTSDIYGWITSSHNISYYAKDSGSGIDDYNTSINNLALEAIQLADATIDFSQYDTNNDGIVEHIIIIHSGSDQAYTGNSGDIWSHNWFINGNVATPYTTNDGVKIYTYSLFAEDSPLGIMAHEFGHDLGLVDLYKTTGTSESVIGKYSLMDYGLWNNNGVTPSHPCVWDKILLKWITPSTISSATPNYTLNDIEDNNVAVKISHTEADNVNNEYFLISNRQKKGYDSYLPGSGILVYHINDDRGTLTQNDVQIYTTPRVRIVPADNTYPSSDKGASGDYWQNNFIGLTATSTPNNAADNGKTMNLPIITNIGNSSSSMSVSFLGTAISDSIYYNIKTFNNHTLNLSWTVDNNFLSKSNISYYKIDTYNLSELLKTTTSTSTSLTDTINNTEINIQIKAYDANNNILTKSKKIILVDTASLQNITTTLNGINININSDTIVNITNITDYQSTKEYIVLPKKSNFYLYSKYLQTSLTDLNLCLKNNLDTLFINVSVKDSYPVVIRNIDVNADIYKNTINNISTEKSYTGFELFVLDNNEKVKTDFTNYFSKISMSWTGNPNIYSFYYLDETDSAWKKITNTSTDSNYVVSEVNHLTVFMIVPVSDVKPKFLIYPNPFYKSQSQYIKFDLDTDNDNIPEISIFPKEINIYNIAGEHITTITGTGNTQIKWDGKINGNTVASGVYLVVGSTYYGKVTGKFAIIK